MHATRRTGHVYTSVRVHPVKLLILAAALMLMGGTMASDGALWVIAGIPVILAGMWLAYIALRQMARGARTFLS